MLERRATKRTRIPNPPSHCMTARQRRIPRGHSLRSAITVDPVVVKPETDSKRAAVGARRGSPSRKGIAPKHALSTQPSPTISTPSRRGIRSRVLLPETMRIMPATKVIPPRNHQRHDSCSMRIDRVIIGKDAAGHHCHAFQRKQPAEHLGHQAEVHTLFLLIIPPLCDEVFTRDKTPAAGQNPDESAGPSCWLPPPGYECTNILTAGTARYFSLLDRMFSITPEPPGSMQQFEQFLEHLRGNHGVNVVARFHHIIGTWHNSFQPPQQSHQD